MDENAELVMLNWMNSRFSQSPDLPGRMDLGIVQRIVSSPERLLSQ